VGFRYRPEPSEPTGLVFEEAWVPVWVSWVPWVPAEGVGSGVGSDFSTYRISRVSEPTPDPMEPIQEPTIPQKPPRWVPVWVPIGTHGSRNPQCSWQDAQAQTESRRSHALTIGEMNREHRRLGVTASIQGASQGATRDTRGHLAWKNTLSAASRRRARAATPHVAQLVTSSCGARRTIPELAARGAQSGRRWS
jgi:hypothetical protein